MSRCTAAASSCDGSSLFSSSPSVCVSRLKNNTTCLSCQLIRWNLIAQPQSSKRATVLKSSPYYVDSCLLPAGGWGVDKERAAHSLHLCCSFLAMRTRAQCVQSCILTVLSIAFIQFCYVYKLKIKLGVQTVTQVKSISAQELQQNFFSSSIIAYFLCLIY